jgi:tetratricopeptide (TPR) repeat protein
VPIHRIFFLWLIVTLSPLFATAQAIHDLLRKADSLYYLPFPEESDDVLAIDFYSRVITNVPDPEMVSDFVRAAENLGNLQLIYGQQSQAAESYRKGLFFARAFQQPDTVIYSTHLFLWEVLFRMSRLDSAIYHLKEAERIQSALSSDSGLPERLFNALGVYYFETGNYLQSIQYFTQAESFLESESTDYEQFARYSFLSNKASALYHLERYDSARAIYYRLLDLNINSNQVRINLANTFLKEERGLEAIDILNQVIGVSGTNYLSYLNLQTKALLQLDSLAGADSLLLLTQRSFDSLSVGSKNYQRGIFFANYGDFYEKQGRLQEAIAYYHQSVMELHPSFEDEDIFENPTDLSLGMGAVSLFESLVSKAEFSWSFFLRNEDKAYFDLGWDTYQAAFELVDYISSNFDNDEARIFLGDQALQAYRKALGQLHEFSKENQDPKIAHQAFLWAEKSKSTALRLGVLESQKRQDAGVPNDLIQEEQSILQQLAKNYRDQYESPDEQKLEGLKKEYTDLQVRLSRIRDEIKDTSIGSGTKDSLSLDMIQQLLPKDGLILSFFESEQQMHLFLLSSESLSWKVLEWSGEKREKLLDWKGQVRSWKSGMTYQTPDFVFQLGKDIFDGWEYDLEEASHLTVIPHGVFSGVSFDEFLIDRKMLIEWVPISYQFSALQLRKRDYTNWSDSDMVSFAPFDSQAGPEGLGLPVLPGSFEEINSLSGLKFVGAAATLDRFLNLASQNKIIHLATHAMASDEDSDASFVAFFPEGDFRLFENELRFQPLDQVDLVFLSACETGSGQFSESEGLVSLARAFSFAGVDNLVSTLWLTEDKVSAYLSREFYRELEKGLTYAEALRKAKLTFLNDPEMAQFNQPPYWTNFVLVGQIQEKSIWNSLIQLILIVGIILILAGLIYWFFISR